MLNLFGKTGQRKNVILVGTNVEKHEGWDGKTLAEVCQEIGAIKIEETEVNAAGGTYEALAIITKNAEYVIGKSRPFKAENLDDVEVLGTCVINVRRKQLPTDAEGEYTGDKTMSLGNPSTVSRTKGRELVSAEPAKATANA